MPFATPTEEALELWQSIIGIKADSENAPYEIARKFQLIKQALELDPSELVATMILADQLRKHISEKIVSLADLVERPAAVNETVSSVKRLLAILQRNEIVEATTTFQAAVENGLRHYGVSEREDVRSLIDTPEELALIRRDALNTVQTLRVDQFAHGVSDPAGQKPSYFHDVLLWCNINSMLKAAIAMPSGVSLNLVRDPTGHRSFFCFLVRNGGNLFVISDYKTPAHPLNGFWSDKPEKRRSRQAQHWFPYDLRGNRWDENRQHSPATQTSGIVPYQEKPDTLQTISELGAHELIWTLMMFDLIITKFWEEGYVASELSYTAEMIRTQATSGALPVAGFSPLDVPELTPHLVSTDKVDGHSAIGQQKHKQYAWMEKRYSQLVNADAINVVSSSGNSVKLVGSDLSVEKATGKRPEKDGPLELGHLDAASFGSAAQILNDRIFIARHNYAKQINRLAVEEFKATRAEVQAWYQTAVRRNAEAILGLCGNGPLWVPDGLTSVGCGLMRMNNVPTLTNWAETNEAGDEVLHYPHLPHCIRMLNVLSIKEKYSQRFHCGGKTTLKDTEAWKATCVMTDAKATHIVTFTPMVVDDLALLTGVAVGDLPEVLQHWSQYEHSTGNGTFGRYDPMEQEIKNPWIELRFEVAVPFSRKAFLKQREKAFMPEELARRVMQDVPDDAQSVNWKTVEGTAKA